MSEAGVGGARALLQRSALQHLESVFAYRPSILSTPLHMRTSHTFVHSLELL